MNAKPIVYFEKNEAWLFDGENFTSCDFSAAKKYHSGMSISLSKLQVGSFKFPSTLNENELQIQTEIKMHEEGGLHTENVYEIASYNHALEFENSTLVEVFALDHDEFSESYGDIANKAKVIDWVVPSFITYSSYYIYNEVEAKTDLFFYLGEDESYAVLFHNGIYIAHRRILSINELAKEINVDEKRCQDLLQKYGLDEDKCPEQDLPFISLLQGVFAKQVEKIVHTINHKRGLFGIEGIDRIFIDFQGNDLAGLQDIFSAYGMDNIEVQKLVFKEEDSLHSHRFVKAMYLYLCVNKLMPSPLNISPYERQAPWFKRHSGHLMAVSAAALVLSLIHPGYFYFQGKIYDEKINSIEGKLSSIESESKVLGVKLKALQDEVKKSKVQIKAMKDSNKVYEITLDTLPILMNKRNIRQGMMYDAVDLLKKYQLSSIALDQNSTDSMNIHVIAHYRSRDKIAKFMKAWMQSGYKEASTKEIFLDKNIYESKIEVLR